MSIKKTSEKQYNPGKKQEIRQWFAPDTLVQNAILSTGIAKILKKQYF